MKKKSDMASRFKRTKSEKLVSSSEPTLAENIQNATLEAKVAWYERALQAISKNDLATDPERTK